MLSARATMNVLLAILAIVLVILVASLWKNGVTDSGTPTNGNGGDVVDNGGADGGSDDEVPYGGDGLGDDSGDDQTTTSSDTGNIVVFEPDPNDGVGLPLVITGRARVFENTLSYRLTDGNGVVLAEGFTTADAPDIGQFGEFEITANYDEPATDAGTLKVFNYSARDGSEENVVSIPVSFADVDALTLVVYFSTDATADDCQTVAAVERRVARTQAVARAAIEELLKGPAVDESADGYTTSIPSGVRLVDISITDGVATVEFSKELDESVGGSCRVSVIRSQIEETLKQFSSVDSVVINVEGKSTDEVLQP